MIISAGVANSKKMMYTNGVSDQEHSDIDDADNELKRVQESSLIINEDAEEHNFMQTTLNSMRKNKYFCDVILYVGNVEIYGHRVILASVSSYLFELFTSDLEPLRHTKENILTYRLDSEKFHKESLQLLIDYAYTSYMEIPFMNVRHVYMTAFYLKMDNVVQKCAKHLALHLTIDNCIMVRSLPGIFRNREFVNAVDEFIASNLKKIVQNSKLLGLSCVQIEIVNQSKQEMNLLTDDSLCRSVLDWIRRQFDNKKQLNINSIFEQVYLLYLAVDNLLQDCNDLPPENQISDSDLIQDYKRKSQKQRNQKVLNNTLCNITESTNGYVASNGENNRKKGLNQPSRPRVLVYQKPCDYKQLRSNTTRNGIEHNSDEDKQFEDWAVIASAKVSENNFMACVMIDGKLATLSVNLRLTTHNGSTSPTSNNTKASIVTQNRELTPPRNGNSYATANDSVTINVEDDQKPDLYCELAKMLNGRCGFGCASYQNSVLICGGYDRTECLKSVELYHPNKNAWQSLPDMREPRGRFQIAVINDTTVYAICGSNGTTELDSIDKFSMGEKKWSKAAKLPFPGSNLGVCTLENRIYCIGGWNGEAGIKKCQIFDPETNKCSNIASLNAGRYQAAIEAYNGRVYVIGGCDSWNCLNSVEVYNPELDKWSLLKPILTCRRGCAAKVFNDKLYVIGGSDGSQSLKTIEIFDFKTEQWVIGPSLTTARANLGVAIVDGRFYAIGGFSGKHFLNTVEYLDPVADEWTTFIPNVSV